MTSYQTRKAKAIARTLEECRKVSTLTPTELARVVAHMSADQWRTVCFASGVAVADIPAKAEALRLLRSKGVHVIPRRGLRASS